MNFQTIVFTLAGLLLIPIKSPCQESWSLEKCIQYGLEHSLTLRQSKVDAQQAEVNHIAAKQLRYPDLNGSTRYDVSFGRQIDRATNDFINQQFGNQSLNLSTGVTLFNGGRINDQIKRARLGMRASELDASQMENDISLEIANAYIRILFAKENLSNAQKNVELIQNQLDNTDKLIEAGTRPRNERLDLVAQVAQNEQLVVAAQNEIDIAYLNLKQLMQLDASYDLEIEVPDIDLPSDYDIASLDAENVYAKAVDWQPQIKAGELRRQNAEIDVNLSKTAMMPSLTFGAGVSSFFSSAARMRGAQIGTDVESLDGFEVNGEPLNVTLASPVFAFDRVNYSDQLNQNLGFGLGVGLSVPIYNRGQNKGSLEFSKLEVVRTEIANEQVKNQLKSNIQLAVADVKAAKEQYEAALRTAEANRAAYLDAEKRFSLGVSNSLDFTTAQNNRDRAETDLIIAKYDFIFRSKVLDYYQGNQITLD